MISVIRSILGQPYEVVRPVLETTQSPEIQEILSNQEKDLFKFISNTAKASTQTPSEELFLKKFPEYTVPLQKQSVLSIADAIVQTSIVLNKRKNQSISSKLMTLATKVAEHGLSREDADKITSLVQEEKGEEEVDVTESAETFREFYEKKKQLPAGLQFFVKDIDEKVGGLAPGMCGVIGGYTGAGKSTLAINIAYANAKQNKYNICYISMEMTKEDVLFDLFSRHSYEKKFDKFPFIGHQKIRQCTMSQEEEAYLMDVVAPDYFATGGQIKILDETDFKSMSKLEVRRKLEEVDDEMMQKTGYPLDAVVWDHMNLFKFNGSSLSKGSSEGAQINEWVSYVRQLALNFRRDPQTGEKKKLAMIMLAQINRDGWKRAVKNKGAYDLRALADANELERAATVVLTIFTDDDLKGAKEAVACLLKNRNGAPLGTTVSLFADFEAYVVGDEMAGFNDVMTVSDVESVFDSGDLKLDIFD